MFERLSWMPSWMYPWRGAWWRYLRRVQLENRTAERKSVSTNVLTTAGVLAERASPGLVFVFSSSSIKGREPSQLFRYWQFVTALERGEVPVRRRERSIVSELRSTVDEAGFGGYTVLSFSR